MSLHILSWINRLNFNSEIWKFWWESRNRIISKCNSEPIRNSISRDQLISVLKFCIIRVCEVIVRIVGKWEYLSNRNDYISNGSNFRRHVVMNNNFDRSCCQSNVSINIDLIHVSIEMDSWDICCSDIRSVRKYKVHVSSKISNCVITYSSNVICWEQIFSKSIYLAHWLELLIHCLASCIGIVIGRHLHQVRETIVVTSCSWNWNERSSCVDWIHIQWNWMLLKSICTLGDCSKSICMESCEISLLTIRCMTDIIKHL